MMNDREPSESANGAPPQWWRSLLWPGWRRRVAMLRWQLPWLVGAGWLVMGCVWLWNGPWESDHPVALVVGWAMLMASVLQFHMGCAVVVMGVMAAVLRCKWTAGAAAVLAVGMIGPDIWSIGGAGPREVTDPGGELRIMSANLLASNQDASVLLEQIERENPDVILLQEYTPTWHRLVTDAGLGSDRYPHTVRQWRSDAFGMAIYSRLPFVGEVEENWEAGGVPVPQMRFVVQPRGCVAVTVYGVHPLPPLSRSYYPRHLAQARAITEKVSGESGPVIVAGDLNFTPRSTHARRLRAAGFVEAGDGVLGRGTTWPVKGALDLRWVPGIRLDQSWDRGLDVVSARVLEANGSDHRPIVVEYALPRDGE